MPQYISGKIVNNNTVASVYPFSDNSTFTSATGEFITPDCFLDARIYISDLNGFVYVSSISIVNERLYVSIADNVQEIGKAEIDLSESFSSSEYSFFTILSPYSNEIGSLALNVYRLMASMSNTDFIEFSDDALRFTVSVVEHVPNNGVSALYGSNNTLVSNEVWLVGGDGITLEATDNDIKAHATGERFFKRKTCVEETEEYSSPIPIKSLVINSVEVLPDESGVIYFTSEESRPTGATRALPGSDLATVSSENIIRIYMEDNALRIELLPDLY